jgi:hypothetical protein
VDGGTLPAPLDAPLVVSALVDSGATGTWAEALLIAEPGSKAATPQAPTLLGPGHAGPAERAQADQGG